MAQVTAAIDVALKCWVCGSNLDDRPLRRDEPSNPTIRVEPCPKCIEAARAEGRKEAESERE